MSDKRGYRIAVPLMHIGVQLGEMLVGMAVYCVIVGFLIEHFEIGAMNIGSAVTLLNSIILGLLYGFRNRAAYDRWWEGRKLWGQLVNDSRNLAIKISVLAPRRAIEQLRIGDLIAGFADALRLHLRKTPAQPKDFAGLPTFSSGTSHIPLELAQQLYGQLARWWRESEIDGHAFQILDVHARALLDVCGGCERINNTPLPASYKGMLRAGLALDIVVAPWFIMAELRFWGIPVLLLTAFFLLGVELIDTAIEAPFGTDQDDLDLDRYCRTIRDGVATALPTTTTRVEFAGTKSTMG